MGLPHALFVAGNRKTLLTLRSVPDASCCPFHVAFLHAAEAGSPAHLALTEVQFEFGRSGGIVRFNPVGWVRSAED